MYNLRYLLRLESSNPDSKRKKHRTKKQDRFRPLLEALEDRLTPTTIATFVDDNWTCINHIGPGTTIAIGDTVQNDNDTIGPGSVTAIYGVTGFGTVTNGPATGTAAGGALINDAISNTTTGGTVNVLEGTYAQEVIVNKSLTLLGAEHGVDARNTRGVESTVTGAGNNGDTPFSVTANDVTIDGFTVTGATSPNLLGFGIVLGASTSGAHVVNNIIDNNIAGLSLANSSNSDQAIIQHNLFENNNQAGPVSGTAIYTDQFNAGGSVNDVLIDSNAFSNDQNAAVIIGPTDPTKADANLTISNNTMAGEGNGVLLFNTSNSFITNNQITDGLASQVVIGGGVSNVQITGNLIRDGATRGIRIGDFGGGSANASLTIAQNNIEGNPTAGLDIDSSKYTGTLSAMNNWWGSPTGPRIASNPGGGGDAIVETVAGTTNYQPFLNHVALPYADDFSEAGTQLRRSWQQQAGFFTVQSKQATAGTSPSLATLVNLTAADVTVEANINFTAMGSAGLVARYSGIGAGPANAQMYWAGVVIDNTGTRAEIWKLVGGMWTRLGTASLGNPVADYQFVVQGSSLQLFLNHSNTALVTATDSSLNFAGSAGFWGSQGALFSNVSVTGTVINVNSSLPFTDTFTQANGSGLSSSWTQVAGNLTVQNNRLVANSNGENFAIVNNVSIANAVLQADVTLANNNSSAGLSLRSSGLNDLNQYWGGIIRDKNGNFTASIWIQQNGTFMPLTSLTPLMGFSGSGTIVFESIGTDLKLFVNGQLTTFAHNAGLAAAGAVGLWGSNGATFDNFHADQIVVQNATLPFMDHFNQANGDLNRTWGEVEGGIEVQNNQLQSFATGGSSAILNGVTATNATVAADVSVVNSGSAGVTARESADGQNEYWGGIINTNGVYTAELWVKLAGNWSRLVPAQMLVGFTGTGHVNLQVNSSSIQLFLNNSATPIVFTTDTQLTTAGSVGVWVSNGNTMDNFNADAL